MPSIDEAACARHAEGDGVRPIGGTTPGVHTMCGRVVASLLVFWGGALFLTAQAGGTLRSGPKEGDFLPKPFAAYNFNGPHKGRFHCLVCRYALNPTVLIFAREPEEGKDGALQGLLKALEETAGEFKKDQLQTAVVFLSPDARSAVTDPKEADPANLVEEARKRDALYDRLSKLAAGFKNVDVAVFSKDGPAGYEINPKAEVTVLFYSKLRVVMNRAFEASALKQEDTEKIMGRVRETLEPVQKK